MVKKLLLTGLFLLLIIPIVFSLSVTTTPLTINTAPNHDLLIKVNDADNGNKVQEITKSSGESGKIETNIYSVGANELNIEISASKDYTEVTRETFGPFSVNEAITIDLSVGGQTQETETTTEEIQETEQIETTDSRKVTGQIVGNETSGSFSLKNLWYIAVVVVLGVGVFFGVRFFKKRRGMLKSPQNIIIKKQSDLVKEQKEAMKEVKEIGGKKLNELEARMKEIQAEIAKIKNVDKIREAEDRVREEMMRLERLRRGEE